MIVRGGVKKNQCTVHARKLQLANTSNLKNVRTMPDLTQACQAYSLR